MVGDVVAVAEGGNPAVAGGVVLGTFVHLDDLVIAYFDNGESVVTTKDHRFWNATTQSWLEISEFNAGDELQTADGDVVVFDSLDTTSVADDAYTLDVDGPSTFFVGTGSELVLVHNANSCKPSDVLQTAMDAANRPKPTTVVPNNGSWQTHHILPTSALRLRAGLEDLIVRISGGANNVDDFMNAASNGAHLPNHRPAGYTGQLHNGSHTYVADGSYTQSVISEIQGAAVNALPPGDQARITDLLQLDTYLANHPGSVADVKAAIEIKLEEIGGLLETSTDGFPPLNARATN